MPRDQPLRLNRLPCPEGLPPIAVAQRDTFLAKTEAAFNSEVKASGEKAGTRRPAQGVPGFRVVRFPSKKNARNGVNVFLSCESRLERNCALVLERDCSIQAYVSQPVAIPLPGGISHFVDFVALDWDGYPHYREVKAAPGKVGASAMEKVLTAQRLLRDWGLDYQILYADDLPSGLELSNLQYLYSQYDSPPTDVSRELVLCDLQARLPSTYGELRGQFGDVVAFLMFVGLVAFDSSELVTYHTIITRCTAKSQDANKEKQR